MDISVVIVCWNGVPYILDCLESVFAQSKRDFSCEVFVVDNASTDGSVQAIRSAYPSVRIIENTENLGFAAANNQAIARACGDFILLLNPDTIVPDGSLNVLWHTILEHPEVGILAPKLLNPDGSTQPSVLRFPSLQSSITGFIRSRLHGTSKRIPKGIEGRDISYVPYASGACLLIRRGVFEQIGLLDESYFIYGEEADFCYRATEAGWKVAYAHVPSVIHLGGQSTKKQANERMYVERRKNSVRFVLQHRGRLEAYLRALFAEANLFLRYLMSGKEKKRCSYKRALSLYHHSVYPMLSQHERDDENSS